jgi:hypothetical protein
MPGNSPAAVNYGGNLVLSHSTVVHIDLGGPNPGSGYDQLNVAGRAFLDGTLAFDLYGGFVPQSGETFSIFNAGSFVGSFSAYTGLNLGNGYELAPTFGSGGLSFTVTPVPEPGSFLLLAGPAAIGWVRYWRRR